MPRFYYRLSLYLFFHLCNICTYVCMYIRATSEPTTTSNKFTSKTGCHLKGFFFVVKNKHRMGACRNVHFLKQQCKKGFRADQLLKPYPAWVSHFAWYSECLNFIFELCVVSNGVRSWYFQRSLCCMCT
jgi:hypothetical protein